jgi:hypothetical protein
MKIKALLGSFEAFWVCVIDQLIFKLCTNKFGGIVYFVEKRAHFFH